MDGKLSCLNSYALNGSNTFGFTMNNGIIEAKAEKMAVVLRNAATINGGEILSPYITVYTKDKLTINDGYIYSSGSSPVYAYSGADIEINNGTIYSKADHALCLNDNSTVEIKNATLKTEGKSVGAIISGFNDKITITNATLISTNGYGIAAFKDCEVTLNNSTINSCSQCLTGNGTDGSVSASTAAGNNAKFNINGGTYISENGPALYIPQVDGITTITDGTIKGVSAIEIRAGNLNISGGTFISTTDDEDSIANGSGSTTKGSAIVVAQHTTKKAINVNISGGTFRGHCAFLEHNPQGNSAQDLAKITLNITGGDFYNKSAQDEKTVSSVDCTGFITGGKFDKNPDVDYIANNYSSYAIANNRYIVLPAGEIATSSDEIYLKVGETFDVNDIIVNTDLKEYMELYIPNASQEFVEGNDLTINAIKAGKSIITLKLGNNTKNLTVYSFEAKPVDENNISDVNANNQLLDLITDLVANPTENFEGLDDETAEAIIDAVKNGMVVETEIVTSDINLEEKKDDLDAIRASLKDNNIMEIFDISIILKVNGTEIGKLTKLGEAIEIVVTVPDAVPELQEGFTRTYSVVRVHNGEVEVLAEGLKDVNGKIKVSSDKFSTYALLYHDAELANAPEQQNNQTSNNVKTGDVIAIWIGAIAVSFFGILKIKQIKLKIRGKHRRR